MKIRTLKLQNFDSIAVSKKRPRLYFFIAFYLIFSYKNIKRTEKLQRRTTPSGLFCQQIYKETCRVFCELGFAN
jgi:hypothetical protein